MRDNIKQTVFVSALLHDTKRRILLVRRSLNDHFLPGYLELPGGRVMQGQSLEQTLLQKLVGELDITTNSPIYFQSFGSTNKHGPYLRVVFEVAYDKQTIKLTPNHNEYIWADNAVLKNDKIAADSKQVLKHYLTNTTREAVGIAKATTLIIYTDGGSRGNPGPSASGYVIYSKNNTILETGGEYLGITTNNQAEYTALALALKAAQKYAGTTDAIQFRIDSLLVVNQMNRVYKVKNRDLWPIYQEIHELIKLYKKVTFVHVYRENNIAADSKVNEVLDAHVK